MKSSEPRTRSPHKSSRAVAGDRLGLSAKEVFPRYEHVFLMEQARKDLEPKELILCHYFPKIKQQNFTFSYQFPQPRQLLTTL